VDVAFFCGVLLDGIISQGDFCFPRAGWQKMALDMGFENFILGVVLFSICFL